MKQFENHLYLEKGITVLLKLLSKKKSLAHINRTFPEIRLDVFSEFFEFYFLVCPLRH